MHEHEHPDYDMSDHDMSGHDMSGHDMNGHGGSGHMGHAAHHAVMFRNLFVVMVVLAIPTVAASPGFADLLGYSVPDHGWVTWISPVFGTIMYIWGGRPFLTGAVSEIRSRTPGMMLLIALGITVAFLASWAARLGLIDRSMDYWWELALLIVIMLLGHWIEMRSLAQSSSALDSLASLLPDTAERVVGADDDGNGGHTESVAPGDLRVGDLVAVRPGGRVPADGVIVTGAADVDESMITGESTPVRRAQGDHVVGATIATDNAIRVRVQAVGEDTTLAGISRMVEQAQNSSTRTQRFADRAAALLFWYAVIAALLTIIIWAAIGEPYDGLTHAITVLVIACPHALGLAIPLVVAIATERAAKMGMLVKDRAALESLRSVDTIVFDKTGTLTTGHPAVVGVVPADPADTADQILATAAAVESSSEHPLARAIVEAASRRGLTVPPVSDFSADIGSGVRARVEMSGDGHTGSHDVAVGGPGMLADLDLDGHEVDTDDWSRHGYTVLYVVADRHVRGAISLTDEIRPQSRDAVDALHARGVSVVMLTGDAESVAEAVGEELGIDQVVAGVRPDGKAQAVASLQADGHHVAMVGDGVNDAPALATADVGIAIGAGTDVAIDSAGLILAGNDPRTVVSAMELSDAARRKMVQNLWWAAGYNLIAVPLAAGLLAPIGFVMPMEVGAILMSISTVVVALNAQLLRRTHFTFQDSQEPGDSGHSGHSDHSGSDGSGHEHHGHRSHRDRSADPASPVDSQS